MFFIRLVSILCFIGFSGCAGEYGLEDLYGEWKYKEGNEEISITFRKDSSFELKLSGEVRESKLIGRFEADFKKEPIPLSLRRIRGLNHPLHTIIEFRAKDKIRMGNFAPRWRLRPIAFEKDTSIVLSKQ